MYKVISSTHIQQMPEIKEPKRQDYEHRYDYDNAMGFFDALSARQPTILRGDNNTWSIGQVLQDEEVEIEEQFNYGYHVGIPDWGKVPETLIGCMKTQLRTVAIPKQRPIEEVFKEAMEKEFPISDLAGNWLDNANKIKRMGAEWALKFLLNNKMIK